MTKPQHHPRCECDFCFTDDLNGVLRRFLEQREARQAERHAEEMAAAVARLNRELTGAGS